MLANESCAVLGMHNGGGEEAAVLGRSECLVGGTEKFEQPMTARRYFVIDPS